MKRLFAGLIALALVACLGFWAREHLISTVRIEGSSMENALTSGDVALVLKRGPLYREIAFGDVVECDFPGREGSYVKRVIGLPGDDIRFSNGALTRGGRPVSEPYVSSETGDFEISLGEDEVLLLGDNRAQSYDSRAEDMGCPPQEEILGRVCWILWPLSRFGPVR